MTDIDFTCPHCSFEREFSDIEYLKPYFGECIRCAGHYAFFIRDGENAEDIFGVGVSMPCYITVTFRLNNLDNLEKLKRIILEHIKREVPKLVASCDVSEQK